MNRFASRASGSGSTRRHHVQRMVVALGMSAALVGAQLSIAAAPAAAGQVGVNVQIQGSGSVAVVEGSIEDGASTVCNWTSNKDERVTNSCPRIRNEEAFEAWVWLRATPSSVPEGHWRFSAWTGCDELRDKEGTTECGVHSGAFTNDERFPKAHFADDAAPTVSPVSETFSTTVERRVTWSFSTNEGQLQCRSDAEVLFTACTSPVVKDYAGEGVHTMEVRAIDDSGQVSSPSARTVYVLDTALTGGPTGLVNGNDPAFTFSSGAGTGFMCSLDGAAFAPCNTGSRSYLDLADGSHTFRVYSTNGGWWDRVPAVRTWTIDATPPETNLSEVSVGGQQASFSFAGSGIGFQCRLDGPGASGTWTACTNPQAHTGLADGAYTFSARAVDAAGNVDPTPSTHSWTVDVTAPNTTVVAGPAQGSFVLSPDAAFTFAATEAASAFACTLDAVPIACGTSLGLNGLGHATHTLTVAASDSNSNTDPSPATRTWTVPLDSTELAHGTGWVKRSSANAYLGTYSQATKKGATLTRSVTDARKIALVATRAPGYGKLRVFAGTRLLKTVDLRAATLRTKQLLPVTTFDAPYSGKLRIVVYTAGKVVRVEGLGVAS